MTSGAQINGYGIIVSNNEYGIVGTASIRFNNAVNLSAYKILDVSDLTGTYFICFEVSGNVNVVSSSRSCIAHKTEAILSNSYLVVKQYGIYEFDKANTQFLPP